MALALGMGAVHASERPGSIGAVLSAVVTRLVPAPGLNDASGQQLKDRISDLRQAGTSPIADEKAGLRRVTLENEALSYGMRSALAWRYGNIEKMLFQYEPQIDLIFNFAPLMVDGVGLPPVVSEFRDGFRVDNSVSATATAVGYRIEFPARIVSAPPTWRDFLVKHYANPEAPFDAILPKNDEEAKAWKRAIDKGWKDGVLQAEHIFEANLALLGRTLNGMLLFDRLAMEGVVDEPRVSRTPEGIVLDAQTLDVGRVIYRLPNQPRFQAPQNWKPLSESRNVTRRPQ